MVRKVSVWLMACMVLGMLSVAGYAGAQSGADTLVPLDASRPAPSATQTQSAPPEQGATVQQVPSAQGTSDYKLGVGDKLRITTFGEPNLSGDFEVSSNGSISMPLIGELHAVGLTVLQLRDAIVSRLTAGYLRDPRVSIEVATYRPFFIVGEVMKPGNYAYVNGMTIINAVAMAGGYTYRADKDDITVKRGASAQEQKVEEMTAVMPGDVIRVPERFF